MGRAIEGAEGRWFYSCLVRPGAQGHRVIYERTSDGIYDMRLLHTAMDLEGLEDRQDG